MDKNNVAYEQEVTHLIAKGKFDDAIITCAKWYGACGQTATTYPIYRTANAIGAARLGDNESAKECFAKATMLGSTPK